MTVLTHVQDGGPDEAEGGSSLSSIGGDFASEILELTNWINRIIKLSTTAFNENFSKVPEKYRTLYTDLLNRINAKNEEDSIDIEELKGASQDQELKFYHKLHLKLFTQTIKLMGITQNLY